MKTYKFTSVIWEEDEGYVSKCPELNVASAGDTVEEALTNLKEAVELYLENAKVLGLLRDIDREFKTDRRFSSPFEVAVS
jgi:predicted RNase H-like HicB family nuclease